MPESIDVASPPLAEPAAAGLMAPTYMVADLAAAAHCSPAAIRRWQRAGLLSPTRSPSGYRLFRESDLQVARRIAHLRNVEKLSIEAIRRVLERDGLLRDGPPSTASNNSAMGPHLRRLRRERAISLRQAAQGSGLSTSFLSSLERSHIGISVASLKKLLDYYGVTISQLLEGRGGGVRKGRLTRALKRPTLDNQYSGVTIEQLTRGRFLMDPSLFTIQPGGGSGGAYSHQGEEFVYVIGGQVEIVLGDSERYRLHVGDCLYFPSTIEHSWRNHTDSPAHVFWVNTPPTF
jgi:DNA-binding transcriptional MerR regulator